MPKLAYHLKSITPNKKKIKENYKKKLKVSKDKRNKSLSLENKDALYTCKYAQAISRWFLQISMVSRVIYVFSLFICIPLALLDKGFVEGQMNYV